MLNPLRPAMNRVFTPVGKMLVRISADDSVPEDGA